MVLTERWNFKFATTVALFAIGWLATWSLAQDPLPAPPTSPQESTPPTAEGNHPELLAAIRLGVIQVELEPLVPTATRRGLQWSPKGTKVPLDATTDGLEGEIEIGDFVPVPIRFQHPSAPDQPGRMGLDSNRDGTYSAAEVTSIAPREVRGKTWFSHQATIELPLTDKDSRPYPISIWLVDDPAEPDAPPMIRWSRQGWHEGTFTFRGKACTVVLSDRDCDGRFSQQDAWGLGATVSEAHSAKNSTTSIDQHNWLDGVAFRVVSVDPAGKEISFQAYDPGVTEAEDRLANDPYAEDRKYDRARTPVQFSNDVDAAIKQAAQNDQRVLVDFVTTWCGPCARMDQLVYTAQPMKDFQNTGSVLFVKIDGDEQAELVKRFEVTGYPTLVLLNGDGQVLRKATGYQSVQQLLRFIQSDGGK